MVCPLSPKTTHQGYALRCSPLARPDEGIGQGNLSIKGLGAVALRFAHPLTLRTPCPQPREQDGQGEEWLGSAGIGTDLDFRNLDVNQETARDFVVIPANQAVPAGDVSTSA